MMSVSHNGLVGERAKLGASVGVVAKMNGTPIYSGNGSVGSVLNYAVNDTIQKPILQTLQPIVNILTIIQSETFWLNVFGIIVGLVILFLAIQGLMKQEIIGSIKKAL